MDVVEAEGVETGWRARPAILAVLGALAALAVQQLAAPDRVYNVAEWRISIAMTIGTAALAVGFALERVRIAWVLIFAAVGGVAAGLVHHWSGGGAGWPFGDWRAPSLFVALAIALPLFQTARAEGAARFPYRAVHANAWGNALLWFAGWVFTGVVFALCWLLASLFQLIGIRFLIRLLEHGWFWALVLGAAFGAALGLLREQGRVLVLLQRVVLTIFSVLAPVLGAGLVLFLLALPFTGLDVLWRATESATGILLSAAAGALLLSNAVIGDGPEDEGRNPLLRWGALGLAACVLPLTLLAAVATGLRLHQYGATPQRLWALTFVAIGCAYGLAYLVALVRARRGWAAPVRVANLRLAFGVAAVALVLATPIISFNAIATRAQVARLTGGKVSPDKFDWAALRFDFGESGKRAVTALTRSTNTGIASAARDAAKAEYRYAVQEKTRAAVAADQLTPRLTVLPRPVALPPELVRRLTDWQACGDDKTVRCIVTWTPGATEAFAVEQSCLKTPPPAVNGQYVALMGCSVTRVFVDGGEWRAERLGEVGADRNELTPAQRAAIQRGAVEVRPVQRRQVAIGGTVVGEAFQ